LKKEEEEEEYDDDDDDDSASSLLIRRYMTAAVKMARDSLKKLTIAVGDLQLHDFHTGSD
jgi:hypothetical protein